MASAWGQDKVNQRQRCSCSSIGLMYKAAFVPENLHRYILAACHAFLLSVAFHKLFVPIVRTGFEVEPASVGGVSRHVSVSARVLQRT